MIPPPPAPVTPARSYASDGLRGIGRPVPLKIMSSIMERDRPDAKLPVTKSPMATHNVAFLPKMLQKTKEKREKLNDYGLMGEHAYSENLP